MGKTPSKHQRTLPEYIPTNRKHIYQTNVRNFATWEHGEVLVSNDPSRLATGGMQNLDRHKQLISPSLPTKYNVNKSRSVENLLSVPTVVTAHQLLYGSSGEISRSKSPSELSVQSDQSSTSSTKQRRKKVPRDLTFVLINPQELQVNLSSSPSLLHHPSRIHVKSAKEISVQSITLSIKEQHKSQLKLFTFKTIPLQSKDPLWIRMKACVCYFMKHI